MNNVIIPVIRKLYPKLIASEITSVQPITIYSYIQTYYDNESILPYGVILPLFTTSFVMGGDVLAWCNDTFGVNGTRWNHSNGRAYSFLNEEDRTLFLLRWA